MSMPIKSVQGNSSIISFVGCHTKHVFITLFLLAGIMLLPLTSALGGTRYHVATNGTPGGAGTIASPWSIQRGLDVTATPHAAAGDTVWIHGGTYTSTMMADPNTFQFELAGTSDALPVIIRNWNNERVIWQGNAAEVAVYHGGQYSWLWGIEITSTRQPAGDNSGYLMSGYRNKFINGYIHDTQSTGVVSQQVQGTEVYGSIINYNGRQQVAEEGPGYGAYAQNVIAGLRRKDFIDNIMAYNWSWGLHFYTEGATCDSIWAEGNAIYNSGLFWKVTSWSPQFLFTGPANANRWFNLKSNHMYLGPEHGGGGHYLGLFGSPITNMTMTNNFMVAPGGGQAMSFENDGGSNTVSTNVFVGNTSGLGSYTNNTFLSGWPTTRPDDIFVRKNKYEPNRANVIAYNWDESPTITINPNANGTVLENGDTYIVKDGLNYWGANVTTGTYNGGNITIPMTGLTAATPIGASTPSHTAPRFATFILIGSGFIAIFPTGSISVSPTTLPAGGGSVTLSWTSQNATSASIDQGIGTVALSGSLTRSVTSTTTFTLTLTGLSGSVNYPATVVVNTSVPAVPALLSPAAGATSQPTTLLLSWSTSNGATSYRLQVSPDSLFGSLLLNDSTITTTSRQVTSLANNMRYFWRVRAKNGAGTSAFSVARNFTTIVAAPSVPILISPAAGAINQPTTLTLSWSASANATSYRLQVSPDSLFGALTLNDSTITATSRPVSSLSNNTRYFWRVRAKNSTGTSAFSAPRNFTTIVAVPPIPTVPTLVSPVAGAINQATTLTLSWNASTNATSYRLQVASDSLFGTLTVNDSTMTGTSRLVSALDYSTRYFWRVNAKNSSGTSAFSTARNYTTTAAPAVTGTFTADPTTLPAGGGLVTLTWTSQNATVARIDNGVGNVALNGSTSVTIGVSTAFTLTLLNGNDSTLYIASVVVALPGGQGGQDITSIGTPITLAPSPGGPGNPSIEIARDGVLPPVGSSYPMAQYDTYAGGSPRSVDWIGYQFSAPQSFSQVLFQEGMHFPDGGWFLNLEVQVRVGGVWTNVTDLSSTPAYPGQSGLNFDTYTLSFAPLVGDAIRIAGAPGGSAYYASIGELRVFSSGTPGFPVILQGTGPEERTVDFSVTKPPNATQALLTMSVYDADAAAEGELQINGNTPIPLFGAFAADTNDQRVVGLTFATPANEWNDGTNSLRFVHTSTGGYRIENAWVVFEVGTELVPSVPAHVSPSNKAKNLSLTPTIRWKRSPGATTYHLQVSRDSLFSTTALNDSTLVDSSLRVGALSYSTKYFWRVRAKNAAGRSQFSAPWSLITKKFRRDITADGSVVSLIAQPSGGGNPNREIIRDHVVPPEGNGNPLDQYDTFTGTTRSFDWIGYTFNSSHTFSNLEFQEGLESDSGGWFASLQVQVRINGFWTDVQNLTIIPDYMPNNGISFELYELNFDSTVADGVRIAGTPGGIYTYISVAELRAQDDDTSMTGVEGEELIPGMIRLDQNYPNPFNPSTSIRFSVGFPSGQIAEVSRQTEVSLKVYDMLGREVSTLVDKEMHPGTYTVQWDARGVATGMYICVLRVGDLSNMRRMILLK